MKQFLLVLALMLSSTQLCAADEATEAEFKKAYSAYQQAMLNKDRSEARIQAEVAYHTGRKVFGDSHANTAALATNYGRLLQGDEAVPILRKALEINEQLYGQDALELIDPLMDLATAEIDFRRLRAARKHYDRALKLAEKHDSPKGKLVARLSLEMGKLALSDAYSVEAIHYFNKAKKIFSSFDDQEAKIGLAMANFWSGKFKLATQKYKTATKNLLASLATLEQLAPNSQITLSNHAFLIEAYEYRGLRDEATKHCRAIGAAKPVDPNQDYKPVYTVRPIYPISAQRAGHEGYAIVSLTVDKDGFVKAPQVIELQGDDAFGDAALEAAVKFRYVPRFENGEAVETHDVKYRFSFALAD